MVCQHKLIWVADSRDLNYEEQVFVKDDFHPRRFYNIAYSALYAHYRYHLELNAFMETTCSRIRLHNAF